MEMFEEKLNYLTDNKNFIKFFKKILADLIKLNKDVILEKIIKIIFNFKDIDI
jgi:hypothetical protein